MIWLCHPSGQVLKGEADVKSWGFNAMSNIGNICGFCQAWRHFANEPKLESSVQD